jgi:hypothetical protein
MTACTERHLRELLAEGEAEGEGEGEGPKAMPKEGTA